MQVDTLSQSTEEMEEDRDGIGLARSQQTDAALMGYKRRPQQEEQSPVATSDTEVSLWSGCQCSCTQRTQVHRQETGCKVELCGENVSAGFEGETDGPAESGG